MADSLINNYDDPQSDQARYDYKFSYQLAMPSEYSSDNWALLLV